MALDLALSDLSHLDRVRRVLADNDPNKQFAELGMAEVHISDDVLSLLCDVIDRHVVKTNRVAGPATQVRMIVDPILIWRDGASHEEVLPPHVRSRRPSAAR